MQWDATVNADFTTGAPWLPVPPSAHEHNVALEERDPGSLLNFYRRLIALRRRSPALLDGGYQSVGTDEHVFAYRRSARGQTIFVALNMSAESRDFRLPAQSGGATRRLEVLLSSQPRAARRVAGDGLRLAPFEAVVIARAR